MLKLNMIVFLGEPALRALAPPDDLNCCLQCPDDFNDLHQFNVLTWQWETIIAFGAKPSPRRYPGFSSVHHKLFLFGGQQNGSGTNYNSYLLINQCSNVWCRSDCLGDFFVFDLTTNNWVELREQDLNGKIPSPRYGHGLVTAFKKIYVFGGTCGNILEVNGKYPESSDALIEICLN